MNWIGFQRFFTQSLVDRKLRESVKKYKLRPLLEIVKHYEEIKYKCLEAERTKNGKSDYYEACLYSFAWILNDKKNK